MTDLKAKLQSLRAVAEAATPGPWEFDHAVDTQSGTMTRAIYHKPTEYHTLEIVETPDDEGGECIHQSDADAKFIATARNEFLPLLDALSEAVEALDAIARQEDRWSMDEAKVATNALTRVTALLGEKR